MNGKIFYDDNGLHKVGNRNWHKYLSEYGWEKLENSWKKKLGMNVKNFPFGYLDCGAGGDCLFSVIAEAMNLDEIYNTGDSVKYDIDNIRKVAADQVNEMNFTEIIGIYRAMYDNDDFEGEWNPLEVDTVEQLREIIKTNGDNFWGDHITLHLLQKGLDIRFIIMKTEFSLSEDSGCHFYPIGQDMDGGSKYILIYYTDEIHFQLVGYFDGNKMVSLFSYEQLPEKFIDMYKRDMNKV